MKRLRKWDFHCMYQDLRRLKPINCRRSPIRFSDPAILTKIIPQSRKLSWKFLLDNPHPKHNFFLVPYFSKKGLFSGCISLPALVLKVLLAVMYFLSFHDWHVENADLWLLLCKWRSQLDCLTETPIGDPRLQAKNFSYNVCHILKNTTFMTPKIAIKMFRKF